MSRDASRFMATARSLGVAAVAVLVLGCGRGDANASKDAGSEGARAAGAPADTGADVAPTPGFTSARGTPPTLPAPAVAPPTAAAQMAPLPEGDLTARASAEEQAALRALPTGPGHALVVGSCLTCHAATMITQQHKDSAGWNKTVTQMVAWGAPLAKEQQTALVAYLAEHYRERAAGEPPRPAP